MRPEAGTIQFRMSCRKALRLFSLILSLTLPLHTAAQSGGIPSIFARRSLFRPIRQISNRLCWFHSMPSARRLSIRVPRQPCPTIRKTFNSLVSMLLTCRSFSSALCLLLAITSM